MKRIFACLLSLGLIGSLSACGAADTAATSAATSAAASVSSVSAAESVSAASGADSASASASASASSSASTSSSASASSSDVAAGVSNVPVVDISSEDKDLTGDDGTTALVTTTTPTVSVTIDGNDAAAAAIQEDIDAQIATFTDSLTETLSWAKDDYDSRSSADQQTWTPYGATLEVTLERCDEQVLSLLFSSYSYTGGAHGLTDLSARNYDVSTGDVLTLSTLSADGGETLTDTCANSVLEQGEKLEEKDSLYDDWEDELDNIVNDNCFYFSDQGLVFIANDEVIAPHAVGAIQFTIPYSDLKDVMASQYLF